MRLYHYAMVTTRGPWAHIDRTLGQYHTRFLADGTLHRLLTPIARLVEIKALQTVTGQGVEAARESLVIGTF